ncbi:HEXXH motif-containing putative peptide modification protein [Nonomuraea sp. NPDC050786]|uniref:aKG-HExxH-type peptide beta-hydroxylase n=1 Tax=Nonomuraea sp. NPDC050786 TaxID=3154840 RepID=UPI00340D55CE
MTPRLDQSTIAAFARPGGWTETTQAVFAARYLHTLVGVRRLAALLPEPVLAASGFSGCLRALTEAPAPVQRRVLGHPSVAFWNDVAWDLLRRRAHERFPDVHLIPHLREFARPACAALYLAGTGRLDATVRADPRGRVSLPGAGLTLAMGEPRHRVRLTVEEATFAGDPPLLRVPRLSGGIELNWLDHDLRLGGRADFSFADLDPAAAEHWRATLEEQLQLIARVSEPLAEELSGGVSVIVPVRSPDERRHLSGSFREAPGLVALSLGRPLSIVEALVHEYGHQKLNAIMRLTPLIVEDTGEPLHYSPWRDDPRPLSGLLHAVYSFAMALHFHRGLLDLPDAGGMRPEEVEARAYRIGRQIRAGLDGLREHATLSPLGEAFVAEIAAWAEECDDGLPLPPSGERRRIDAELAAHRARWDQRNPPSPMLEEPAPVLPDPAAAAVLRALGLPEQWVPDGVVRRWYPGDSLLEAARALPADVELPSVTPGTSLTADLAAAHVAYVRGDYRAAAEHYASCVRLDPRTPYFWQCYAFALRHLGRHDEALHILTQTEQLMAKAEPPTVDQDLRPSAEPILTLPAKPPTRTRSVLLPVSRPVEAELRGSPYWNFVAATLAGAQLPTLIAVAHGLKPAMDAWIPEDGWYPFLALVDELGLRYHVDACFDRFSPQLAQVPPGQLTTTRAAFAPALTEGTEAHVFLARDSAALDRVVAVGWYPLIVNGKLVNKHRADHDKFGDALGYPRCCQDFFRARNNWNDDNTYYAALRNTHGDPSLLCNPFIRHRVHGLIAYMPCSYTCAATRQYAGRLRDVIRAELPAYAHEIERVSAKPLLCVSELRMYGFTGETLTRSADTVTIDYESAETLYPVEHSDPLADLLASGDRCTLDGNIIHVRRNGEYLDSYEARNDRHGPECPFVISFGAR